jgi:hypothetical protein
MCASVRSINRTNAKQHAVLFVCLQPKGRGIENRVVVIAAGGVQTGP